MIVHVFESAPYADPEEAYFVDLEQISETSPKELQEYKKILEEAVALGKEKINVHSKCTIMGGYIDGEKEVGFDQLPCVVTPPCLVDASVRVTIFFCNCPCHDGRNKDRTHIMTCFRGQKCWQPDTH